MLKLETGCCFSTHRYSDLLLISKLKPYIKNIHNAHIRHCGSRISGNLHCHQLQIHTGTGNLRQQKAFAVRLERPRQVGPASEEGGDGVRDGCLHLWELPCSTTPQSDQFGEGTSRPEQCGNHGAHRAQTRTSQRFPKPMKEKDGRSYMLWDFLPQFASDTHLEGLLPGWTQARGAGCEGGVTAAVPEPPPWLCPQMPVATAMAWARIEDAPWVPMGAGALSSLPSSGPGKRVELSASYN